MSLSWKIFSLIVDVGLLIVFLKFLVDYRCLGRRIMVAEACIDRLEQDKRTLYRKLNEVQGGVKNKPAEKARDQLARNSDNTSDPGSSFSYMSTMMSDTSTQSDSSSGGYSSSDSGSSSSSSSSDSSSF